MPIPDYQSLMLSVMQQAWEANDEGLRVRDVVDGLGKKLHLSEQEKMELLPSGKQTVFANRVHWAKSYLTKAGLVESTKRGHFRVTDIGLGVMRKPPERIDNAYLRRFQSFREFTDRADPLITEEQAPLAVLTQQSDTPDEIVRKIHRQIEASLAQDLLQRVRLAPPEFFERLIVGLLLEMGYGGSAAEAGRALGRSGDDGIDGVIDQDALGLDRVYIQAKRYAEGNNIGAGAIRDFFGSLDRHKASKGLFVTTSSFTSSARETADFLSKRLVLMDGDQLARLMIRHNVGCRIEETLHLKKVDEDFFD